MAQVTIAPNAWNKNGSAWTTTGIDDEHFTQGNKPVGYRFDIPKITEAGVKIVADTKYRSYGSSHQSTILLDCTFKGSKIRRYEPQSDSFRREEFEFENIGIFTNPETAPVYFNAYSSYDAGYIKNPRMIVTMPDLSVSASPDNTYTNYPISLQFTGRDGYKLYVDLYSGSTKLNDNPYVINRDYTSISVPSNYISGTSASVTFKVYDDFGREATSNAVTVKKPQAMTASPTAPRSTQEQGGNYIPFTWTASGDGTISSSKIRWSANNVDWTETDPIENGETVWYADPLTFPAGTIYWQVKVTSSFGLESAWSSSAQFTAKYNAVSQVVPVNSQTSGNISASIDETFTVALEASAPVYSPFIVQAATYYWRSNEMGSFTAVTMTPGGNTASVTIPAGTFESGTLEWYAEATDTTGRTTRTGNFTLTALVASIEAVPLSPISTVEAGNAPILFRWRYASLDGTLQKRAELQYSINGTNWTIFGRPTGTETEFEAPADTFPGHTILWQVRAYNADDVAGPWSSSAPFVVVGAPVISSVDGDGKPFLTVSWQTPDQLAYEVRIDGKVYGPYRDESARSFKLREPLPDGVHDIAVRAQNQYSLWSRWREAQISVQNVPGEAVSIAQEVIPSTDEPLVTPGAAAMSIEGAAVNIILEQPRDVQTTDPELAALSVAFTAGESYTGKLQRRAAGGSAWSTAYFFTGEQAVPNNVILNIKLHDIFLRQTLEDLDGSSFRFVINSDAGDAISREAVYTYAEPYKRSQQITGYFPPETGYYLIYRDGVLIGKTYSGAYTDKTAAPGEHTYFAVQTIKNGYYTKSNSVTITTEARCPMLALLTDADFLELELSAEADRSQTITKGGEAVYVQYSGAKFPEAEVGEAESLTVTGDGSFTAEQEAEARRFEAMLKKPVIYKTPGGEVVVGVLQGFTRRDPRFFKSYGFQVTQMEWRDFTNA